MSKRKHSGSFYEAVQAAFNTRVFNYEERYEDIPTHPWKENFRIDVADTFFFSTPPFTYGDQMPHKINGKTGSTQGKEVIVPNSNLLVWTKYYEKGSEDILLTRFRLINPPSSETNPPRPPSPRSSSPPPSSHLNDNPHRTYFSQNQAAPMPHAQRLVTYERRPPSATYGQLSTQYTQTHQRYQPYANTITIDFNNNNQQTTQYTNAITNETALCLFHVVILQKKESQVVESKVEKQINIDPRCFDKPTVNNIGPTAFEIKEPKFHAGPHTIKVIGTHLHASWGVLVKRSKDSNTQQDKPHWKVGYTLEDPNCIHQLLQRPNIHLDIANSVRKMQVICSFRLSQYMEPSKYELYLKVHDSVFKVNCLIEFYEKQDYPPPASTISADNLEFLQNFIVTMPLDLQQAMQLGDTHWVAHLSAQYGIDMPHICTATYLEYSRVNGCDKGRSGGCCIAVKEWVDLARSSGNKSTLLFAIVWVRAAMRKCDPALLDGLRQYVLDNKYLEFDALLHELSVLEGSIQPARTEKHPAPASRPDTRPALENPNKKRERDMDRQMYDDRSDGSDDGGEYPEPTHYRARDFGSPPPHSHPHSHPLHPPHLPHPPHPPHLRHPSPPPHPRRHPSPPPRPHPHQHHLSSPPLSRHLSPPPHPQHLRHPSPPPHPRHPSPPPHPPIPATIRHPTNERLHPALSPSLSHLSSSFSSFNPSRAHTIPPPSRPPPTGGRAPDAPVARKSTPPISKSAETVSVDSKQQHDYDDRESRERELNKLVFTRIAPVSANSKYPIPSLAPSESTPFIFHDFTPPPTTTTVSHLPTSHLPTHIHANTHTSFSTYNPLAYPSPKPQTITITLTKDILQLKQADAAKKLGMKVATLSKKWSEAVGKRKWPHRNILKNQQDEQMLEHLRQQGQDVTQQLEHLRMRQEQNMQEVDIIVTEDLISHRDTGDPPPVITHISNNSNSSSSSGSNSRDSSDPAPNSPTPPSSPSPPSSPHPSRTNTPQFKVKHGPPLSAPASGAKK